MFISLSHCLARLDKVRNEIAPTRKNIVLGRVFLDFIVLQSEISCLMAYGFVIYKSFFDYSVHHYVFNKCYVYAFGMFVFT